MTLIMYQSQQIMRQGFVKKKKKLLKLFIVSLNFSRDGIDA